jgi:hypothetical protein
MSFTVAEAGVFVEAEGIGVAAGVVAGGGGGGGHR